MPDEVFVLLLIPIACFCAGMTLHYAVRPFVEALLAAIREPGRARIGNDQLDALRGELHELTEQVHALRAQSEFDRQLAAGASSEATHQGGSA